MVMYIVVAGPRRATGGAGAIPVLRPARHQVINRDHALAALLAMTIPILSK